MVESGPMMRLRPCSTVIAGCLAAGLAAPVRAADMAAPTAADPFSTEEAPATPSGAQPSEPAAPEAPPEPTAIDWSALFGRQIDLVYDGRKMRGKMTSHTESTVTITESNGVVSDLPKEKITEAREVPKVERKSEYDPTLDEAPQRRSELARAARRAERAEEEAGSFRNRGAFLLVSPGFVAIPFSAANTVFYRWGLSFGGMVPARNSGFTGAYCFTLEHLYDKNKTTVPVPGEFGTDVTFESITLKSNIVRGLAEVRLGGSADKIFGYVLLGAGFSIFSVKASTSGTGLNSTFGGFAMPFGAGVQGMLGDYFILGFEPRIVVDVFAHGAAASFDARLLLGAKF
jgi:hypothetical protein